MDGNRDYTEVPSWGTAFLLASSFWCFSFQFIPVATLSELTIKVQYLFLAVLLVHTLLNRARAQNFKVSLPPIIVVLIWFYVASSAGWLINALIVSPHDNFAPLFVEHVLVIPLLLIVFSFFRRRFRLHHKLLTRVSVLFILMSALGMMYLAGLAEVSLPQVVRKYLAGDGTLQFLLFRKIYEGTGGESSAARHTMMYMFFLLAAFLRCARLAEARISKPFSIEPLELVLITLVVFVGVSRKVTLTLVIFYGLCLALEYRHFAPSISDRYKVWLTVGAVSAIAIVAATIVYLPSAVTASLQDRYIVDVLNNSRIYQFGLVFDETLASLSTALTGVGLGPKVSNGHHAHNLVLFFLHQGGLFLGLLASALLLYTIKLLWYSYELSRDMPQWTVWMKMAAVACFLIVLTRFSVGNKGELAIVGVVAIALAATLLEQAQELRRSDSKQTVSQI